MNQKWSTATRLSSDAVLRKLMPPLRREYGNVVRALQSEKDTLSGETKWRLYRPDQHASPCATDTKLSLVPQGHASEHPLQIDEPAEQAIDPEPKAAGRLRRTIEFRKQVLPLTSRTVQKLVITPLADAADALANTADALANTADALANTAANTADTLARAIQTFVAMPDKMERMKDAASNLSSRTNWLLQDPRVQWLECALAISIGLTLAFTATLPGGLTLAVLSGFLVPPVRHHIGSLTPLFATPATKVIGVFALLVACGSLELITPERRQANVTLDFFTTNREAIIAEAQSSLDTLDYVGVVKQLEPYRTLGDEAIASLLEAAQPEADIELARLKKIASQFLFNGSNRYMTEYIVKSMDDPGSFRHLNTDYWIHDEYLEVQTAYSSLSDTGTTVAKTVKAYIDFDGRILNGRRAP